MAAILDLTTRPIRVRQPGGTAELPFALADIARRLTPFPPSEAAWEAAIMQVEDGIAPLAGRLGAGPVLVEGAAGLAVLPHTAAAGSSILRADTLETAFAVLAGYRPAHSLPPLPPTPEFAAAVLLLREWAHHLGFSQLAIAAGYPA